MFATNKKNFFKKVWGLKLAQLSKQQTNLIDKTIFWKQN